MPDEDRPDGYCGATTETPVSAVETLPAGTPSLSLARDLGVLSLVGAPYVLELVAAGDVDYLAFALAVSVTAVFATVGLRWVPLSPPSSLRERVALVAVTFAGCVAVTYWVVVLEPPAVWFSSVAVGVLAGAITARLGARR